MFTPPSPRLSPSYSTISPCERPRKKVSPLSSRILKQTFSDVGRINGVAEDRVASHRHATDSQVTRVMQSSEGAIVIGGKSQKRIHHVRSKVWKRSHLVLQPSFHLPALWFTLAARFLGYFVSLVSKLIFLHLKIKGLTKI